MNQATPIDHLGQPRIRSPTARRSAPPSSTPPPRCLARSPTPRPPVLSFMPATTRRSPSTFTPTDKIDYTIATATTTITVNQATPTITWASPAPIAYGTALGATQLDATASVPGSFTYSPAAGTVLRLGNNQPLSATFAPTDTSDYTSTSATTRITVVPATTVVALASSSADPSTYGQSVTFDAAVATIGCGSTAISGTVAFYDGKPVRGESRSDRPRPSRRCMRASPRRHSRAACTRSTPSTLLTRFRAWSTRRHL